jgi:hypothetical protein
MQSKYHSFLEANANTIIGLMVSWTLMQLCMRLVPVMGLFWATNVGVAVCTVWSVIRNYYLRRHFNSKIKIEPVAVVTQEGVEMLASIGRLAPGTRLYVLPAAA